MQAWGFHKSNLVAQDSEGRRLGPVGFYFRNVTEILLFGVRGKHARTLKPGHSSQCVQQGSASIRASRTSNIAFLKGAAGVLTLNCSRGVSVMVGVVGVARRKKYQPTAGRLTAIIPAPTCSRRFWPGRFAGATSDL